MSDTLDNVDVENYINTSLHPEVTLKELGFKFEGTSTTGSQHWLRQLGRGFWESVIVKADGNINYRKVKMNGRGIGGTWQVHDYNVDATLNDIRRKVLKWKHEDAQEVIHRLLDAENDALDPKATLDQHANTRCPHCGSSNISHKEGEAISDCYSCGCWFQPDVYLPVQEANDNPDDPEMFLHSMPPHPEAAGMIQSNKNAAYWHYSFVTRDGYNLKLAISHSIVKHDDGTPCRYGSYTISLNTNSVSPTWNLDAGATFLALELKVREAAHRFIQTVRKNRITFDDADDLWHQLFDPFKTRTESLEDEIPDVKDYALRHGAKPFGYVLRSRVKGTGYPWMNTRWSDRSDCCGNFRRHLGDATVFKRQSTVKGYTGLDAVPVYSDPRKTGNRALSPYNVNEEHENPDDPENFIRDFIQRIPPLNPRICISFSQTTPESSEQGDYSDSGWINEEGVEMTPDEFDQEEGLTAVDLAVKFLQNEGAMETSSSQFHPGVWYSTTWNTVNYRTGTDEERSFHLKDFSPAEEQEIWDKIHERWNRARRPH